MLYKIAIKKIGEKKGQALILAYMTIVFFTILSTPIFDTIISERWRLERQRLEKEAFYLAEGGIEEATNQFISAIANFEIQPNVGRYPLSGTIPTDYVSSAAFPTGAQVNSFIKEAEDDMRQITESDGNVVNKKTYIVNSVCEHPVNTKIKVTLNQVIVLRIIYTFQHAVFYTDDLEILPGPNMNFSGRVHSNKDMYLDSNGILTINSEYVRSAGNIYNQRKDWPLEPPGDVRIKKAGTGAYFNMAGLDSDNPNWLTESQSRWNGTVKSSVHGVTKLSTPVVGSIQPDGYYTANANVIIENGIIRQSGRILVEGTDVPTGTITTDTDFYNNREGKYVRMTNIDLKKLAGYAPGDAEGSPSFPNHLSSNGLIYATRDDAGTFAPGIRLINGTQIYRSGGLTIVSNDPIYIQGNYNTINKKPTAVICDSVNLLSNNWNDANSSQNLSYRTAANTTINTAFIAGVDNTTTGHYNGGLENYPRLHENWSGKTLYIRGSFVELWNGQISQGAWQYGNPQYKAPIRNWDYDTDFNVNNMPPFTPWAVEAQRGAWWKEQN
ncbi:MAG: hypothetical protein QMD94_02015 [Candidatus Omnitrophota bacterium]|nr:hypothetical protein [Candidatus Omnitrophota bacterium]